jgi:hypothetical protein
VNLLGQKWGSKSYRDFILFAAGIIIMVVYIIKSDVDSISLPILIFGAGLAGAPAVLRTDEKTDKKAKKEDGDGPTA